MTRLTANGLIQGEVHDENAWAMGGIAGDAGLFSTAGDVASFAQMILNGGIYAHHRVVSRATIADFTAHQTIGNSTRTLGWDAPLDPAATGRYFSPHSIGHYGFTGTSLWIDPDRDLFIILLTNRVNPTVETSKSARSAPPSTTRFSRPWALPRGPPPLDNFLVTSLNGFSRSLQSRRLLPVYWILSLRRAVETDRNRTYEPSLARAR